MKKKMAKCSNPLCNIGSNRFSWSLKNSLSFHFHQLFSHGLWYRPSMAPSWTWMFFCMSKNQKLCSITKTWQLYFRFGTDWFWDFTFSYHGIISSMHTMACFHYDDELGRAVVEKREEDKTLKSFFKDSWFGTD